jgi:hypothetical protein
MINLAKFKDRISARLQSISAEEWEQRLRAKGWDVEVTVNETKTEQFYTGEFNMQVLTIQNVVELSQACGTGIVIAQAANSNELALAA